jgi:hypothetical protein
MYEIAAWAVKEINTLRNHDKFGIVIVKVPNCPAMERFRMKRLMPAALILMTSIALAAPAEEVRFDQHESTDGFLLIARGKPELAPDRLQQAFTNKAQALCIGATVPQPPLAAVYFWLDGGTNFLMPAGGILLPMRAPSRIAQAPLLSGKVVCPGVMRPSVPPRRLVVSSKLGAVISYVDQGFASFNRGSLDVPINGHSFDEIATTSLLEALGERGYKVELAVQASPEDALILINKRSTPGEFFDGVTMMTKLNMLGLDEASYAFCSLQISTQSIEAGTPQIIGQVNTREKIAAVYKNWKTEMAEGPSDTIHARSYEVLGRIVANDVRAVVHAIPTETLDKLIRME